MRNRALHDVLRAFAERAAERLAAVVESGCEIPFEVAENPGATSVLYRYRPLSAEFVRARFGDLRGLEGFAPAASTLARVEGVSAYLRVLGSSYVPAAAHDRAEEALKELLARLWDEVTTFELDEQRFERIYAELESTVYENTVVNTVLAPILGARLADRRWELGSGIALTRGDLCEAPAEAVWGGRGGDGEPNTLVLLKVESKPQDPPPLTAARLAFRQLVTALRLFKPGAVALGPTGWWRADEGPWQSAPLRFVGRPGGDDYWLEAAEQEEFSELFELLRSRPARGGALPWALARFESGCECAALVEGLSDHLLAVRALLDGAGSDPTGVSLRLAALCADPSDRVGVQARMEQAFNLERLLMRGEVDTVYLEAIGSDSPDAIARDLEEHLRALLRDIVCGHLDPDVTRVADEQLEAEPGEGRPAADESTSVRQRRFRRAVEPELESWEDVAEDSVSASETANPPEPEFVVRRAGAAAEADRPAADRDELETEEAAVPGGVREVTGEPPDDDWGFDDDASDYSAAV